MKILHVKTTDDPQALSLNPFASLKFLGLLFGALLPGLAVMPLDTALAEECSKGEGRQGCSINASSPAPDNNNSLQSPPAHPPEISQKRLPKMTTGSEKKAAGTECSFPISDEELRKKLTPEQYNIVRRDGTEAPFKNAYWDNKRPGIYVDIVSGEPLFSSTDKFDSGTGWPSFTQPIQGGSLVDRTDTKYGMSRTEVRSPKANSHLGHVFDDGPGPSGKRYCINSGALRFIPVEELEKEGYGELQRLFVDTK